MGIAKGLKQGMKRKIREKKNTIFYDNKKFIKLFFLFFPGADSSNDGV